MQAWLSENWLWVAGAAIVLLMLYLFTRPRKKRLTGEETERVVALLLARLTDAFEQVVDDTVGQHFTRNDRQKIALGMIAIMVSKGISVERVINSHSLFAQLMLQSIAALNASGQIAQR